MAVKLLLVKTNIVNKTNSIGNNCYSMIGISKPCCFVPHTNWEHSILYNSKRRFNLHFCTMYKWELFTIKRKSVHIFLMHIRYKHVCKVEYKCKCFSHFEN